VGAFETKNTLGQLLDLVEQGEEVSRELRGSVRWESPRSAGWKGCSRPGTSMSSMPI